MSIGNDIKPRRVYYPRSHNSQSNSSSSKDFDDEKQKIKFNKIDDDRKEEIEDFSAEKEVPTEENKRNLEKIQDEFFEDYNEPNSPATATSRPTKVIRIGPGKIIAIMVAIIIIILVTQNFSSIKSFLFPKSEKTKTTQSTSNDNIEEYTSSNLVTENANTSSSTNENSNQAANQAQSASQSNSNTPASSNAATTAANSSIALKVLNGNGISGTAASVAEELRNSGFTVQSITNARSFSYSTTIVYYKSGKEAEANLVKNAITNRTVSIEQSDSAVGSLDVVVVVGKK